MGPGGGVFRSAPVVSCSCCLTRRSNSDWEVASLRERMSDVHLPGHVDRRRSHHCGVCWDGPHLLGDAHTHPNTPQTNSQSELDRWFKQQLQETTGADLNTPPPGPISEILTEVEA